MSTTPEPTPSAGAVRAAERIVDASRDEAATFGHYYSEVEARCWIANLAEIIDRETGAGRLADALEDIAKQLKSYELSDDDCENADFEHGYDSCVDVARAALAEYKTTNQTP